MRIATSPDLPISVDIMQKYVVGPTTLKTMMCILSYELDGGVREVYPDAMEARVKFQTDCLVNLVLSKLLSLIVNPGLVSWWSEVYNIYLSNLS